MIACGIRTWATAVLMTASVALAGPIYTGPATTSALGQPLTFNLISTGELGAFSDLPVNPDKYVLQVISTVYSFDPPAGASGFLDLAGTLEVAGADSGLSFAETIDLSDETGNVIFAKNDGGISGLPFSQQLATQLLSNSGKVSGKFVPSAGTEGAWTQFFSSGGKLTNYVFFEISLRDVNQVPEPATMLVWGAMGLAGVGVHQWRRRRRQG